MISDFGTPIQTLLDVKSFWLAVTIFNQIVSWQFDWSLPHHANNRFRGREVKGSSIGILTDSSLVKISWSLREITSQNHVHIIASWTGLISP